MTAAELDKVRAISPRRNKYQRLIVDLIVRRSDTLAGEVISSGNRFPLQGGTINQKK